MSSFIRGTVLSGVVAGLLLAPAVGMAQGGTSVKVGKDGVQVRTGNTSVNTQAGGAEELGGADVEVEDEPGATGEKQAGATLEISGSDSQETHRCSPKTEVNISGSDNDITLTGECKKVSVNGSTNKVKVEAVESIEVTGSENQVTWKRAVGAKKPKVTRTGHDNKVTQAR
ncbi:DUF3060 domain-containing protein [Archangium gephyra]|nr:DUF3060 domain-containing protein [Archangium gephyra]AKJ08350.1 Hypothetical protein AA314_09976 [Archangium gephyra]